MINSNKKQSMIITAVRYATAMHKGQTRRFTGAEYITHPLRVMNAVMVHQEANDNLVCAAVLHDVIEDCNVSYNDVKIAFNKPIADLVQELTNYAHNPKLSREEKKKIDRERLAGVSDEAKIIKLIDRIDNLSEPRYDSKWHEQYQKESYLLWQTALTGVDKELEDTLFKLCRS